MSHHPPHVLLLAAPTRRTAVERRLRDGATALTIAAATPATADRALAEGVPALVVLAPGRAPAAQWAQEFARAFAPTPVVVVWPDDDAPSEIEGVAACLSGDARLAETVGALLTRSAGACGSALKRILGRVTEPLLLVGADGLVIAANAHFAELTGWSDAALVGRPLASAIPAEVAARVERAERADWSADRVRLTVRDGPAVAARVRASVVHVAGGKATWLLRFDRAPAPVLSASPEAAAGAIGALGARAREAGSRIGGANIRMIGLAGVRQQLGERWSGFEARLGAVCESAIAEEIGPDDVAMATKAGDYLICFACDDDQEADRRAERLQATIHARLFADECPPGHGTKADRDALGGVSVEVEAAILAVEAAGDPPRIAERFASACARRRQERLADFNRRLEDLRTSGSLELLAMASARGPLPSLVRAQWFPPDFARLHRLAERANQLEELRLTLDLRRLALVERAGKDGVFDDAAAIVDLHLASLERRRSWDALLPVLQELAASTRRWLVANLTGVPPDAHAGRLRDALVTLKPFSRTQTLTLSARQLASLNLAPLPCRLYLISATEAASALDGELPARIGERLALAGAKLVVDGGSAELAHAFGASLRTVRGEAPVPA
mgnify:FL=1